jgi:hypothetical protein
MQKIDEKVLKELIKTHNSLKRKFQALNRQNNRRTNTRKKL